MIKGLVLALVAVAALIGGRVWGFYDGVYYGQCDQATRANPPAELDEPGPPQCIDERPAVIIRATDWLDAKIRLDHPGYPRAFGRAPAGISCRPADAGC
jgi:hypothetical protein